MTAKNVVFAMIVVTLGPGGLGKVFLHASFTHTAPSCVYIYTHMQTSTQAHTSTHQNLLTIIQRLFDMNKLQLKGIKG